MISVITPVWNRSDLTAQFLYANWLRYQEKDIEFIIVDNGSSDATRQLLDHWAEVGGGQIVVIRNSKNLGFGPANNQGVKAAMYDKLLFINNDVEISGDYITPVVLALDERPDTLVGAQFLNFDTGWNKFNGRIIPYLAGWCVGMTKAVFEALGGFDERYVPGDYEDMDLSYTAFKTGYALMSLDLPLYHRFNQTAQQLPDRRAITERHRRVFAEKWGLAVG